MKFFHVVRIGGTHDPLMIRYILFRCDAFGIYLHKFMRSDHDRALHDHPWPFVAVLLSGGYFEVHDQTITGCQAMDYRRRWSVLVRPAEWRHRVELPDSRKPVWSLCIIGRRCRRWGFFTQQGWCWWRRYNTALGICEDDILYHDGED